MAEPKWGRRSSYQIIVCASCGVEGVLLASTGGSGWKNVGGRYFCDKKVCQDEAKKPVQITGR